MSRGCASLVEPRCPSPKAHQRLEDAHRLWHQTAASYNDPLAFHEGLNETLQALRGGTFALQQETRAGHDFRSWHDAWHRRILGDDVLRWLVQVHRHSVSEEDLEPASKATVTLTTEREGAVLAHFSVPPSIPTEVIPRQLSETRMGPLVKSATHMTVEREWLADDLREHELLQALAHCYGVLAEPLADAHHPAKPLEEPMEEADAPSLADMIREAMGIPLGQPECMTLSREMRISVFRLQAGRVLGPASDALEGDEAEPVRGSAGTKEFEEPEVGPKKDPLAKTAWYFEEARRRLGADGAYSQRVSLYVPGQEWISVVLKPEDVQDRYGLWGRVAREVERTGAEAVLTIFEVAGRKAGESPRLVLAGETAEGYHRTFSATFERRAGQVRFGRTRFDEDGRRWYFLDPIRDVWRKHPGS
ncbi:MAG: hypothetical protein JO247_00700 [Chloroflexi bacterium]|nr:hypothetical protein [Chloroflexota bacterium]